MHLKLISCEIFYREMCAVAARSINQVDVEFLPKGLHDIGAAPMLERLQSALDVLDESEHQAVLFGYALCGNGLAGLTARSKPVVIPRAHDCITLFLGSRRRYLEYFHSHPGVYFKTTGWIERGEGLQPLSQETMKKQGLGYTYEELVAKYGADIVRLWAASSDYSQDVSVSDEILERTSEAYRRIRNTFRFLLSNLADYDPSMAIAWDAMPELDRYALVDLTDLSDRVTKAYDDWKFHHVYHAVYSYCVTDLSSFYLDVLKDRLYADAADAAGRRSAQTVLAEVLRTLVRLMAPILSFTAEEVWQFMSESLRDGIQSVHLAGWPKVDVPIDEAARLREAFAVVLDVRDAVTKALEEGRNAGVIGKSQEARIAITAPAGTADILRARGEDELAEMLIVSAASVSTGDALSIEVLPAQGEKCPRCWNFRTLGSDPSHPEVCSRCAAVLRTLG